MRLCDQIDKVGPETNVADYSGKFSTRVFSGGILKCELRAIILIAILLIFPRV